MIIILLKQRSTEKKNGQENYQKMKMRKMRKMRKMMVVDNEMEMKMKMENDRDQDEENGLKIIVEVMMIR